MINLDRPKREIKDVIQTLKHNETLQLLELHCHGPYETTV